MLNLEHTQSDLESYLSNLSSEMAFDKGKYNQDFNEFYYKSLKTKRNVDTKNLTNLVFSLLPRIEHYIADNVMIIESLQDSFHDLIANAFIIADRAAFEFVQSHYRLDTNSLNINYIDNIISGKDLDALINTLNRTESSYIAAIGGGRTIDYAKFLSFKTPFKLLAIPSSLSTHVYASTKIHALQPINDLGFAKTIDGEAAHLTLIDFKLLNDLYAKNKRLIFSGFGDILAFVNAQNDWKDGAKNGSEIYSEIVDQSIKYIINQLQKIKINLPMKYWVKDYVFIQCLLCNITDWVGSAPASGAEHLFAKCIEDEIGEAPLHGELVALGVLIFCFVRGKDVDLAKKLLKKFNIPTKFQDLDINKDIVVNALCKSHIEGERKNRFTILNKIDNSKTYFTTVINSMIASSLMTE